MPLNLKNEFRYREKLDRMEILDANVLTEIATEENSIVLTTEPTLTCWYK